MQTMKFVCQFSVIRFASIMLRMKTIDKTKPIPEAALGEISAYFQVLSEPLRLRLLSLLREREYSVGELAKIVQSSIANVSRHLANMSQHGLIERKSIGTSVYYRIEDPLVFELCELVCDKLLKRMQDLQRQHQQISHL